jgi:hypothetical protein
MILRTKATFFFASVILSSGLAFGQVTLLDTNFQDVLQSSPFYTYIQLARRIGVAVPASLGPCINVNPGTNPPVFPPPGSGVVVSMPVCPYFGPDTFITRAEAAYWIVRSQADETQITDFLCATGGDPSGLSSGCPNFASSTFVDLGVGGGAIINPFVGPNQAAGVPGVTNARLVRYIEVMARRGYTKGCSGTVDTGRHFCPNDLLNRAQVAVFLIRAKMDTVFPTSLSGATGAPVGDNFSVFPVPFFTDVQPNDPQWGPYYIYIQKLRELNITSGTSPTTYSPANNLSRKEMATFAVRAFFL